MGTPSEDICFDSSVPQTEHTGYKALPLKAGPFFLLMLILNISHHSFETLFRSRQREGFALVLQGIFHNVYQSGLHSHSIRAALARTSKAS